MSSKRSAKRKKKIVPVEEENPVVVAKPKRAAKAKAKPTPPPPPPGLDNTPKAVPVPSVDLTQDAEIQPVAKPIEDKPNTDPANVVAKSACAQPPPDAVPEPAKGGVENAPSGTPKPDESKDASPDNAPGIGSNNSDNGKLDDHQKMHCFYAIPIVFLRIPQKKNSVTKKNHVFRLHL